MKFALVSTIENETRNLPVGLVRIAGHVKKHSNFDVRFIDNTFEDIYEEIDKFKPDIIGLTTFTSFYNDTIDFAKNMKSKYPNIKIIIGGAHISALPNSLHSVFDFGVIGQGEKRTLDLLNALEGNKSLKNIDGLVYHDKGGKLVINKRKPDPELELAKSQMDYSLLNKGYFKKKFLPETGDFKVCMGIFSSIGCPFKCLFCVCRSFWGDIRFLDVERIIKEIQELYHKYSVRHIEFYDDLFVINKKRLTEFYDQLKKVGLLNKVTFSCFARADAFDEEMCKILKKINVKSITFGFESASDRILKYIKNHPNSSDKKNRQAILLGEKYGFRVSGALVTGNPTEKIEDMKKNNDFIDFVKKHHGNRVWIQIMTPFPGTKMWDIAKERGKIDDDFDDYGNLKSGKKINWSHLQVHNRNAALLLDEDVPREEFLKNYNYSKAKCEKFVYRIFFNSIKENPINIFYFLKESPLYLKRFFNFVKQ